MNADTAARLVWQHWTARTTLAALPDECRPRTRLEGYAVQAALAQVAGETVVGWKIAATSAAGQQHIGVDAPLAGRLLASRVVRSRDSVPLAGNTMRVAEAEFVFRMGTTLAPRPAPYTVDDVRAAVAALHPGIEVPDSRFADFARAGGPQLIADNACTDWFVLGPECPPTWRDATLATHRVTMQRNGAPAADGSGAMVLGDPWIALAWIANELRALGEPLAAGMIVTTGTCIVPIAIEAGDTLRADFGALGEVSVTIAR